jgi:two-component system response regulator FlrC
VTAISLIEKEPFAVVITDYMMPVMTGVDLALAIRRISPDTQVILMTAYGSPNLRDTSKFLGLDGFLDKPFPLGEVQEIVKRAVAQTQGARRRAQRVSRPGAMETESVCSDSALPQVSFTL